MTDPPRWRARLALGVLSICELMVMTLWFSASAVVGEMRAAYDLGPTGSAWLTTSVQLGFVIGAFASAVTNLADRVSPVRVFVVSALVGAGANAAIAEPTTPFGAVVLLRMVTGAALAGTYPTGMKIVASWFGRARGAAIGLLVGALTVGSALPHLLRGIVAVDPEAAPDFRLVLTMASGVAAVGAVLAALFVRTGPLVPRAAAFDAKYALRLWTEPALRYTNIGYLGHMWELYAMWTWVPVVVLASYQGAGHSEAAGRIAGFSIVAIGGIGCVVAGALADRIGRTIVAGGSLVVSGACCLAAGFALDAPVALTVVGLVWGLTVVADSAQFSAALSETCDPAYVGTALTMQLASGFLLTLVSIFALPPIAEHVGWGVAFAVLAVGPLVGVYGMAKLRARPEAARIASGRG